MVKNCMDAIFNQLPFQSGLGSICKKAISTKSLFPQIDIDVHKQGGFAVAQGR